MNVRRETFNKVGSLLFAFFFTVLENDRVFVSQSEIESPN